MFSYNVRWGGFHNVNDNAELEEALNEFIEDAKSAQQRNETPPHTYTCWATATATVSASSAKTAKTARKPV
jgi:hypothetical protein